VSKAPLLRRQDTEALVVCQRPKAVANSVKHGCFEMLGAETRPNGPAKDQEILCVCFDNDESTSKRPILTASPIFEDGFDPQTLLTESSRPDRVAVRPIYQVLGISKRMLDDAGGTL
jgi:hypothetical protein